VDGLARRYLAILVAYRRKLLAIESQTSLGLTIAPFPVYTYTERFELRQAWGHCFQFRFWGEESPLHISNPPIFSDPVLLRRETPPFICPPDRNLP
jgi:hypothetical protein